MPLTLEKRSLARMPREELCELRFVLSEILDGAEKKPLSAEEKLRKFYSLAGIVSADADERLAKDERLARQ